MKNMGGFTGAKNFRSKGELKRKTIQGEVPRQKKSPMVKRKAIPKLKGADSTVLKKPTTPGIRKAISGTGMKRFLGGGKLGQIKKTFKANKIKREKGS